MPGVMSALAPVPSSSSTKIAAHPGQAYGCKQDLGPESEEEESSDDDDESHAALNFPILLLVGVASIGGFLFGYDTGVVSGAMIEMKSAASGLSDGGLSNGEQEVVVSSTVAAAAIGAGLSGILQRTSCVGRRGAIMQASVLFILGALLMAVSHGLVALILGRILVGLAVGVASHAVPIYIAEVAPPAWRGSLTTVNNAMVVFGQVSASGVCCVYAHRDLSSGGLDGWRWMLGWAAVPALFMLVGFFLLPESPRWLVHTREDEEAAAAGLMWLRRSKRVAESELQHIIMAREQEHAESDSDDDGMSIVCRVQRVLGKLRAPRVFRALVLGVGLQLLQQLVGINTIMYYSSSILQMSHAGRSECGLSEHIHKKHASANTLTRSDVHDVCMSAPVAGSQLLGNLVGMILIDRFGRRALMLGSLAAVCITLVIMGLAFFTPEDIGWLALLGMCGYLFLFGIGVAPIPWVVNAEIYPQDVRGIASGIATTANWVANFIVAATFLDLATALSTNRTCPGEHPDGAFWLYASISLLGLLWLCRSMPETKGKTLEQIDALFS